MSAALPPPPVPITQSSMDPTFDWVTIPNVPLDTLLYAELTWIIPVTILVTLAFVLGHLISRRVGWKIVAPVSAIGIVAVVGLSLFASQQVSTANHRIAAQTSANLRYAESVQSYRSVDDTNSANFNTWDEQASGWIGQHYGFDPDSTGFTTDKLQSPTTICLDNATPCASADGVLNGQTEVITITWINDVPAVYLNRSTTPMTPIR